MKKIVLTSNTSWSVWNFRRALIEALLERGYEVFVVAPKDEFSNRLPNFIPLKNLDRKGKNPIKDFMLLLEYIKIYKSVKPDVVLNFTIKPNIYSSLACRFLGIRCISTITGLGYVFIKESLLTKLIKFIYKIALGKNQRIVFQNNEDRDLFIKNSLVNKNQTVVIRGSGVDIKYFSPDFCQEVKKDSFIFLMVSRLLWDKGVREFVEAGKDLKKLYDD
ncbi:MAG: glycosyltransferase, partial [Aquificaceae bacterium]